jgi:molecular chaperone GrpE (heat shock protein)
MTRFEKEVGAYPADDLDAAAELRAIDLLERIEEAQQALRQDSAELLRGFERLAGHLGPLLTKQYGDTQARMRVLETRIRNRQERPLVTQMANLLVEVRRLESAEDVKVHVEQAMLQALNSVGYQEMGSAGEPFDPFRHEPVSGSVGKSGIVTRVHRRGLECYGDVIIKAMVEVEPGPATEGAESYAVATDAELATETQQEGLPT